MLKKQETIKIFLKVIMGKSIYVESSSLGIVNKYGSLHNF